MGKKDSFISKKDRWMGQKDSFISKKD
jgi:hypothetical protein